MVTACFAVRVMVYLVPERIALVLVLASGVDHHTHRTVTLTKLHSALLPAASVLIGCCCCRQYDEYIASVDVRTEYVDDKSNHQRVIYKFR